MVLGVEEGIVLAVVASIIDHLRHTYHPLNSVLVKSPARAVTSSRRREALA